MVAPPFPAPVSEWRNDTYAAIDPSRPELSTAGKTIVITGGGTGIGRETVKTFAQAGSKNIHILGRTKASLEETKQIVEKEVPGSQIIVHIADVTDAKAVQKAADAIGKWDILVANAGYLPAPAALKDIDLDDWWLGFEINIKGQVIVAKSFLPNHNAGAAVIGVSSGVITIPTQGAPGISSYTISKMGTSKFFEYIASEYPDIHVVTVHPGVVETAMNKKSELDGLPVDTVQLPAHFFLWAASPEAAFARGRFLFCNWDVPQLKAIEEKFTDPGYLTTGLIGWPFA